LAKGRTVLNRRFAKGRTVLNRRLEIMMYNSSASVNQQSSGFHKISTIFTHFSRIFHVKNASNYEEKANGLETIHFKRKQLNKLAYIPRV
jgi:hypothetical protein